MEEAAERLCQRIRQHYPLNGVQSAMIQKPKYFLTEITDIFGAKQFEG